jgi:hypothetical protein
VDASVLDPVLIALVSTVIALITLIALIVVAIRQSKLLKRYRLLLNGAEGKDIERLLLTQGADIEQLQANHAALEARVHQLAEDAKFHVQKTGTVRFSAFPDTGSDLSFAIALLDAHDDGVVISSLYGRSESRTYAKPIQGGKSTYQLSDEEKEAIAKAIAHGAVPAKAR